MDTSQDSAAYAEDRQEQIRQRAHALWQSRGEPQGLDLEHWMEAERDVGGEAPQPKPLDENLSALGNDPNEKAGRQGA